jgi:hypothetical protein
MSLVVAFAVGHTFCGLAFFSIFGVIPLDSTPHSLFF